MVYNLKDLQSNRSDIPKQPGIYLFKNTINGKCYVGQSVDLRSRLNKHFSNLKNGFTQPIYKAFRKHGLENFTYEILSICNREDLDDKEIFFIQKYDCYMHGYNQTKGGDKGVTGLRLTDEQKKHFSEVQKKIFAEKYAGNPFYCYVIKEDKIYFIESISEIDKYDFIKFRKIDVKRILEGTYRYKNIIIAGSIYDTNLDSLKQKINQCREDGSMFKKKQGEVKCKPQYTNVPFFCYDTITGTIHEVECLNDVIKYPFIKKSKYEVRAILDGTYKCSNLIVSKVVYDYTLEGLKRKIQICKENGSVQ